MIVEYCATDRVAHLTLNRPDKLNAVTPALIDGICAGLRKAISDDVAALVFAGHGSSFCAGHDLDQDLSGDSYFVERERVEAIQDVTRLIRRAPFPVIAAVQGYALGAGCEFALCSDFIVASQDAQFGFPEVNVGLSITGGISHILPSIVGLPRAKELVIFGERFVAGRALELGLVNWVVPPGDLIEFATEKALLLTQKPRQAMSFAKSALDRGAQGDIAAAFDVEALHGLLTRDSDEAVAASVSFHRRHGAGELLNHE